MKNCTNLIAGSGNGAINSVGVGVGVGNRLPQGNIQMKKKLHLNHCHFTENPFRFVVPPAYNVAAQRALLHRLGRAHSHEGVTSSSISISSAPLGFYHQPNTEDTGR